MFKKRRSLQKLMKAAIPSIKHMQFEEFAAPLENNNSGNTVELIVKFNGDIKRVAADLGAQVEILYQDYSIFTIDRQKIPQLYTFPEVEHIELPKNLYSEVSFSLVSTCISSVQDPRNYNLTGEGVIVAVIDSGIDYTHPDFQNEDGTTRILYIWDQTTPGTPPAGFLGGTEYTREQINQALGSPNPSEIVPQMDTNGHGTAVSGIAVGNGRASDGENKGVALNADIIVVRIGTRGFQSFARTTELMRALKYVIEKARELGKPIAINISFGTNDGSHTGDSLFETYITDISYLWKTVIVIPTGNEGAAGHHFEGEIGSFQSTEVTFFTSSGLFNFYITMWKNFTDILSVEVIFPNGVSSGVIRIEDQVETIRQENVVLTLIYGQPNHYSDQQEIYFNFEAIEGTIQPGVWRINIIADRVVDGRFEMWLPTIEEVTPDTAFSNPSVYNTMTIPSTADKVVKVAGYNDRVGNIAEFSGRGSINPALPNPDLAAPAVNILTTRIGGGYDSFTGTSIAAPFVTGAVALMMQWGIVNNNDPFLYGERVKAFLRLGAKRVDGVEYPNPSYGYGTLCLNNTMMYLENYMWGGNPLWLQR